MLEQTEIFSHFVQDGQLTKHSKGGRQSSPLRMKVPTQKQTSSNGGSNTGDHRHRMTEEEEDAELLSDAKEAERSETITRFDHSPWCSY